MGGLESRESRVESRESRACVGCGVWGVACEGM